MQLKYQTQVAKSGAKDGADALSSLDKQEETTFFNAAQIPDTSCKIWSRRHIESSVGSKCWVFDVDSDAGNEQEETIFLNASKMTETKYKFWNQCCSHRLFINSAGVRPQVLDILTVTVIKGLSEVLVTIRSVFKRRCSHNQERL
ncbi:hypothetical protein AVEN_7865-1 [Araneus ventricosus]|uniref:Uncharacterized protein n=1 Tax=Araneus ventricosus TaxID=182803 RepID=A0A4Y2MEX1_ARAVE|nr:hypothetical protein AVEN_7865-1 [Araneus ventricosus]